MAIASLSVPSIGHYCHNSPSFSLKSAFFSKPQKTHVNFTLKTSQKRSTHLVSMIMEAGIGVMGTKLGMMSYFETDGTVVGFREGNIVTQIKTEAIDGYGAVQVGYRRVRDRKLTKPELGHLEKAGVIPMRHVQEFRLLNLDGFEVGQRLAMEEIFKEGDLVDVFGTNIGKGFQGVSKIVLLQASPEDLKVSKIDLQTLPKLGF